MASLPKLNTDGAGITKADAERLLTAFCSTYPDVPKYIRVYAEADIRYTEAMQGMRFDHEEDPSPRSEVCDLP